MNLLDNHQPVVNSKTGNQFVEVMNQNILPGQPQIIGPLNIINKELQPHMNQSPMSIHTNSEMPLQFTLPGPISQ